MASGYQGDEEKNCFLRRSNMYKGPVVDRACDGGLIFNFHIYADYSTFSLIKKNYLKKKKKRKRGDLGGSVG